MKIITNPESVAAAPRVTKYFDRESLKSQPALQGSRCENCGDVHFPHKERCPSCWHDTQPTTLSREGTLYSYAKVNAGPPKFDPPYRISYVDLPEKIRIFSLLNDEDDFTIGDSVTVEVGEIGTEEGEPVYGYLFRADGRNG